MRFGLDFGTSTTVGVVQRPAAPATPLLLDSSPLLASTVHVGPQGTVLTGADADRAALSYPAGWEPNPKRRIDERSVWLGEREVPVVDLVAAVLARQWAEARRVLGGPPAQVVLSHPAAWARTRRDVLAEAARRAGLPPAWFVAEPVAAAAFFAAALGREVPPGRVLAVYDLGAGTFDASAVRRSPAGFEVIATAGLPDAGGLDLDAAVVDHLRSLTGGSAAWARLDAPGNPAEQRARRELWQAARAAKELLSRHAAADVHVPLVEADVHITREEFEAAARPLLERTVATTRAVLGGLGAPPAGVFLVGGSSRIPLVATLLHRALGVEVTAIEQPELVVAHGCLHAVPPPAPVPGVRTQPPPAPPPAPPLTVDGVPRWGVLPADFPVHLVELTLDGRTGYTVRMYAADDAGETSAVFATVDGRLPLFDRPERATAFAAGADAHDLVPVLHWEALSERLAQAFLPLVDDNRYDLDLPAANLLLGPERWLPDPLVTAGAVAMELVEALDLAEGYALIGRGTPLDDLDDALRLARRRPLGRHRKRWQALDRHGLARDWRRLAQTINSRTDWPD